MHQLTKVPEEIVAAVIKTLPDCFRTWGTIELSEPINSPDKPADGVFAIMGFLGKISWNMTLFLPRNSASQLVEHFCGFPIAYHCPDMGDIVGELVNVLAGGVISELEPKQLDLRMGLPMIARGCQIEWLHGFEVPREVLRLNSTSGDFEIQIELARPSRSWIRFASIPQSHH